jgi:isopenicillin N synthase-like dioxygenase
VPSDSPGPHPLVDIYLDTELIKKVLVQQTTSVPELALADYAHGGSAARAAFSRDLMSALQRFGFVIVREHTLPALLLERAYELCAAFFAQPEDMKRRYVGGLRGYAPFGTEHAKNRTTADLKEFWQIGPEPAQRTDERLPGATQPPNVWPESPAGFQETFLALFDTLQASGRMILEALTVGLGVAPDFFEPLLRDCNSVLRLLHYPPVPEDADPDSTRSAAHEDINLLTLLPAPRGSGLEILDRGGQWLGLNTGPSDLIVDSGDMLARMTNDVIPATTHRVVRPADGNLSRYSMPFFMHPNPDVVLSCLPSCRGSGARYPDITAGEFLHTRLREIGLLQA